MKPTELRPSTFVSEAPDAESDPVGMSSDRPAVRGMTRGLDSGRKLLFRLKWAMMSRERRYAYLWATTKRSSGYTGNPRLSRN